MLSFLVRLILFTVAISVVRSLLRFLHGLWLQYTSPGPARTVPGQTPATTLQRDPVCGTYVAVDSSLRKISGGKVYHFCSPECRDRFAG